jgi:hypothetical protein
MNGPGEVVVPDGLGAGGDGDGGTLAGEADGDGTTEPSAGAGDEGGATG